jgi:hypothetical protein
MPACELDKNGGSQMFKLISALGVLAAVFTAGAQAGSIVNPCPQAKADPTGIIGGINTAYQNAVATQGTCNITITFNADGSIVTTLGNANPYDGLEDQLIGVINNTTHVITSISLSNPTASPAIFDFELTAAAGQDGICLYTPFASNSQPCNNPANSGGYLGGASSFSGINAAMTAGTVNFAGIAANGGTSYFSLEGPASLSLQVGPNPVPEPVSLALTGLGLCALIAFSFFRKG